MRNIFTGDMLYNRVKLQSCHAEVRLNDISLNVAGLGRCKALGRLRHDQWAAGATIDCFISWSISLWTTANATTRMPHNLMTEGLGCLIFLFTSHDGLAVLRSECFLASDVMHIVNCKRWLIGEQHAVCHVHQRRQGNNLWLYNHLIEHSEHSNTQKYLVVWPWH